MKKVVITGANGFIGRHCLDLLLNAGFEVHALSYPEKPADNGNLHCYSCNLHDYTQTASLFRKIQPAYLLHLAWYTKPGKYMDSPQNLLWVQSSIELLKIFQENGGKRVVGAGTCMEYDLQYGYLQEYTTPDGSSSLYGSCKASLGKIINAYSLINGLSFAWGRIFYLYGPYENPQRLVPYVINSLLQNKTALCSNGEKILDYLYVKDAAAAFVLLLQSDIKGTINIASGVPIRLSDMLGEIGQKLGKKNLITFDNKPITPDKTKFITANNERLKNLPGWKPAYNLHSGLNETIAWWKNIPGRR